MRQILVKGNFLHSELGISAGFCNRSCLLTHRTKAGISATLIVSKAMTEACLMYDVLVERMLSYLS